MDLAEIRKKAQKERIVVQELQAEEAAEKRLQEEAPAPWELTPPASPGAGEVVPPVAPPEAEASAPQTLEPLTADEVLAEALFPSESVEATRVVAEVAPAPAPQPKKGKSRAAEAAKREVELPEEPEQKVEIALAPVVEKGAPAFDPFALLLAGREAAGVNDDMSALPLQEAEAAAGEYTQFLCFSIAGEEYAVNILDIKEIVKPREVTEVPRAPSFVSGILSLRGIIIPVFDMHLRLGLPKGEPTGKERIVVVRKGEDFCGLAVDKVVKVVKIARKSLEPSPTVLDSIDREFVSGLGRYEGRIFILLDLANVLDMTLLQAREEGGRQ
jgi:purine-binding chemotaxis protein CheW